MMQGQILRDRSFTEVCWSKKVRNYYSVYKPRPICKVNFPRLLHHTDMADVTYAQLASKCTKCPLTTFLHKSLPCLGLHTCPQRSQRVVRQSESILGCWLTRLSFNEWSLYYTIVPLKWCLYEANIEWTHLKVVNSI